MAPNAQGNYYRLTVSRFASAVPLEEQGNRDKYPPGDVCLFSLALIAGTSPQKSISARREQVLFGMAIGNAELMHECFPKHPRMGTAR